MKYCIQCMAYCLSDLDWSTFRRRVFCILENRDKKGRKRKWSVIISSTFLFNNFTHEHGIVIDLIFWSSASRNIITFIIITYYYYYYTGNKYFRNIQCMQIPFLTLFSWMSQNIFNCPLYCRIQENDENFLSRKALRFVSTPISYELSHKIYGLLLPVFGFKFFWKKSILYARKTRK